MKLLLLSAADLRAALPMPAAVEAVRDAFAAFSTGRAQAPPRTQLSVPPAQGVVLAMSGWIAERGLAAKVVSVFPGNRASPGDEGRGRPTIHGLVVVLDPDSGEPRALCDGAFLTAWRTGAATGAATALLAREGARRAALLGSGAQARTQALALDAVCALEELRIFSPTPEHVRRLVDELGPELRATPLACASAAEAVRGAEVVCAATSSAKPVFDGAWLAPGAHVNGVGSFTLEMREIDAATVERARVFVDSREAALVEAGDLVQAAREGRTRPEEWTELGEVIAGRAPGRRTEDEITLFKSVGLAVQDVAAAARAVEAARARGLGREIEL